MLADKEMGKKVSVILPVYNVEKFLPKCLESIINQTYKNLEIILVDDGATDSSLQICKKYANIDSRITVVTKENGGLSDARNYGLRYVTGEYLAFIDSDDYVLLHYIETLVKGIEDYQADISICNYSNIFPDEDVNCERISYRVKTFTKEQALNALFDKKYKMQFTTAWGKVYKSSIFKEIRYPKGRKYEDSAIAHLTYNLSEKVAYTDEKLYMYVQRDGSIKATENFTNMDMLLSIEDKLNFFISYGNLKFVEMCYNEICSCCIGMLVRIDTSNEYQCQLKQEMERRLRRYVSEAKGEHYRFDFMVKIKLILYKLFPKLLKRILIGRLR